MQKWLKCICLVYSFGCATPDRHAFLFPNPEILFKKWVRSTHENVAREDTAGVVVFHNLLAFGSHADGLTVLYPEQNRVRWKLKVDQGIASKMSVVDDVIYFCGVNGYLYAVSILDAKVLWKSDIKVSISSAPAVDYNKVVVHTADDSVYAFELSSGKTIWKYQRNLVNTPRLHEISAPVIIDSSEVLLGFSDGYLVCLSFDKGILKWEIPLNTQQRFIDVAAAPVIEENIIYIPAFDGKLYALDKNTRNKIWQYAAGGAKSVLLDHQSVFFPSSDGYVARLKKSSGTLEWKFELPGVPSDIVMTDQYLFFGSSDQYLYGLDKKTGKPLYRLNVGMRSGIRGGIAFDPMTQHLYVLTDAGNLMAFKVGRPAYKNLKSF